MYSFYISICSVIRKLIIKKRKTIRMKGTNIVYVRQTWESLMDEEIYN